MAGKKTIPHWEEITLKLFEEIKMHPDYGDDIKLLRESLELGGPLFHLNLGRFIRKYETPRGMYGLVRRYIETGNLDPAEIDAPLFIVSEIDAEVLPALHPRLKMQSYIQGVNPRGRILLDLSPDTQRKDIDDFLDLYFDSLIKPKLKALDKDRPGSFRRLQRDKEYYKVVSLYKEKTQGLKNVRGVQQKIAAETEIDPLRIKKMIERYRRQKKFDLFTPSKYREIMGQQQSRS